MKKKLFLLTMLSAVSAATLMGCGNADTSVSHSADATVAIEEASVAESSVATESSADTESSTTTESSADTESSVASESVETAAENTKSADSEVDTSKYIGMTVNDFVAEGNEHAGYTGFNDTYEFDFKNEDTMTAYKATLSDDVVAIMENKEFGQDYEDLIGECTIVDLEAQVADNSKLQKYVGKTLNDLEADGIKHAGHIIMDDFVTLVAYDGPLDVRIEYEEDACAAVIALNDPDRDEVADTLRECPIKSIYYVF